MNSMLQFVICYTVQCRIYSKNLTSKMLVPINSIELQNVYVLAKKAHLTELFVLFDFPLNEQSNAQRR